MHQLMAESNKADCCIIIKIISIAIPIRLALFQGKEVNQRHQHHRVDLHCGDHDRHRGIDPGVECI